MSEPIRYRIVPEHPEAHLFRVSVTVADPDPAGQRFAMPAWIPGSYLIREFSRHVVRLTAEAGGAPVAVEKLDKSTWRCAPCSGPLTVSYEVYAWDLSVRGAHLDTGHGYFNGTCVFLAACGREQEACEVEIAPPPGARYAGWRVATALARDGAPEHGFGRYRAADYDELADHPVEMGGFAQFAFEACGVPHEVAITGRTRCDAQRLADDMKKICEAQIRLFGEPAPVQRYVFLVTAVGEGYGGLEHRASTSLLCSRGDLPAAGMKEPTEDYRTFLGLVSHEYFHTWNVKRIRPQAFTPYDLSREAYTRLLWAFEGITSYYDDYTLLRAGLITAESYLELVGQTVTRVLRGAGRLKQTVAESSFDAWTKFYRQDENSPNAVVSYYAKGALVALALDLLIRRDSGKCLDDVMRALWQRHGQTGEGVPEDGVERIAQEVSGLDLSDFFGRALRSTEDLPLAELLADFGIELRLRRAEGEQDKGGKPGRGGEPKPSLGIRLGGGKAGEARVTNVFDGGAAQEAGLAAGDVIVALDGLRVSASNLDKRLAAHRVGESVRLHAFRRDELMEFDVRPDLPPADTCWLTLVDGADPAVRARRDAWLSGAAAG